MSTERYQAYLMPQDSDCVKGMAFGVSSERRMTGGGGLGI